MLNWIKNLFSQAQVPTTTPTTPAPYKIEPPVVNVVEVEVSKDVIIESSKLGIDAIAEIKAVIPEATVKVKTTPAKKAAVKKAPAKAPAVKKARVKKD